jgi:hypothetical protein
MAMAGPSSVERRFTAMLNPALNRRPMTRFAMLATLLAALFISLPLAALSLRPQAPSASTAAVGATGLQLETSPPSTQADTEPVRLEAAPPTQGETSNQGEVRKAMEAANSARSEAAQRGVEEIRRQLEATGEIERARSELEALLREQEKAQAEMEFRRGAEARRADEEIRRASETVRPELVGVQGALEEIRKAVESGNPAQVELQRAQERRRVSQEAFRRASEAGAPPALAEAQSALEEVRKALEAVPLLGALRAQEEVRKLRLRNGQETTSLPQVDVQRLQTEVLRMQEELRQMIDELRRMVEDTRRNKF